MTRQADGKPAPGPDPARDLEDAVEEMEKIVESGGEGSAEVPPLQEHYGGGERVNTPQPEHPYTELLDSDDDGGKTKP
jgi:hypothetical protein